jgi:hypothetical protein
VSELAKASELKTNNKTPTHMGRGFELRKRDAYTSFWGGVYKYFSIFLFELVSLVSGKNQKANFS